MSLGVLSARQQQLVIHVACGHWPFMDSRRDVGVGQFQNSSRNNNNVIIVNEDVQAATTRDKDELDGLGLNDGNAAGPILVTANTYELYQLLAKRCKCLCWPMYCLSKTAILLLPFKHMDQVRTAFVKLIGD